MTSDCSVTILNVGHGNSTVIRDGEITLVIDTGGELAGNKLLDYLKEERVSVVDALLLSHADEDHIGSAPTLLLSDQINIKKVFLNSDSTKNTKIFDHLRLMLGKARKEKGTQIETSLTMQQTSLIPSSELCYQILFPPPEFVISGPGGKCVDGKLQSTNSLSAAILISSKLCRRVLLPGDSGVDTMTFWRKEKVLPEANVVVFPHHGGRPGSANPDAFARDFVSLTKPSIVVFSIHKTKHDLPRDDVVRAIQAASPTTHLICTQLPEKLEIGATQHPWTHHIVDSGLVTQLHVRVRMPDGTISIINNSL